MVLNVIIQTNSLPGKVFSKTNLSPKRRGKVGGKGFVLTWKPRKQMERLIGPCREPNLV